MSTAIDLIDPTASLEIALSIAHYFYLNLVQAEEIVKEAAKLKIKKQEIDRMSSRFEHEDRQKIRSFS